MSLLFRPPLQADHSVFIYSGLFLDYLRAKAALNAGYPDPMVFDQWSYVDMVDKLNQRLDEAIAALANRDIETVGDLLELVAAAERELSTIDPKLAPHAVELQRALFKGVRKLALKQIR